MSEPNTTEWYSEWINELEAALANERASNALLETYNATLEAERDEARAELQRLRDGIGFVPDGDVSDPAYDDDNTPFPLTEWVTQTEQD